MHAGEQGTCILDIAMYSMLQGAVKAVHIFGKCINRHEVLKRLTGVHHFSGCSWGTPAAQLLHGELSG